MYKSILVPLDGSGRAEKILPHVISLAQCYSARVTFLQVIELTPVLIVDYGLPGGILPELVEQTKTEAEAYLNSWKDKFTEKDIKSGMRVEQGPIVETIIRVAEEEDADLIAMASHGRTGLSHVFYGSVASGVLSRVDRPLLLIRSRDQEGGKIGLRLTSATDQNLWLLSNLRWLLKSPYGNWLDEPYGLPLMSF